MKSISNAFIYSVLILFGIIMIVPFLWMITTSFKTEMEINKPKLTILPKIDRDVYSYKGQDYTIKKIKTDGDSTWVHVFTDEGKIKRPFLKIPTNEIRHEKKIRLNFKNYLIAYKKVPFGRYFLNTIIVSFFVLIGTLITSSLAAYAFARMHFFGKEKLFMFFISMMMIPQPIYLIPSYVLLNQFGWIDTYAALIIPWLANIFTIFLLRQHFKTIPQELFDAASIDGCSQFGILWRIVLPLSKSVLSTAAIFSIIGSWNSFMWPLIMTNSDKLRVLQVGLSYFSQESSSNTSLLMAASSFSIMPLVILFLFAQKHIIASNASSGLKG